MASRAKTYWTSDRVHGPGGRFRVVVSRLPAGGGNLRDSYSASLMRAGEDGRDEVAEAEFWRHTAAPHDADKLAFRDRARKAAEKVAEPAAAESTE